MLKFILYHRLSTMVLQLILHQNMVFQALDFMMADTTMVDIMMAMSEFDTNVSK